MNPTFLMRMLILLLAAFHLTGCPRHLVPPDTRSDDHPDRVLSAIVESAPEDPAADSAIEEADSDAVDFRPAPVEQLHSAMLGLESFRVFGYHFKIQDDTVMLRSLKKPTYEYIADNIDPHLKLKKIKYDPTHQIYIASFLYLKAYLFWIHDDIDSARKTIAVLNRTFPDKHRDIKVFHVDRGRVALDDALYDLEELIGPKPN